jgi:hypothetical protein
MPQCVTSEPDLYALDEAQVRCLLYAERLRDAV